MASDTRDLPPVYLDGEITVVRASASGMCVRALSAYGRYEEVVSLHRRELLERTAGEGRLHETPIIEALRAEGHDVSQAQTEIRLPVIRGHLEIRGHIDGLIPSIPTVVEAKTMSKSRFDEWQRKGLSGFPSYQWQLSCYMYGVSDLLGEMPNALYAVKRRDDGLLDTKHIEHPPIPFQTIRKKMVLVYTNRRNRTLPNCDLPSSEQFWCPFPFLHEEDVSDMPVSEEAEQAIAELATEYDALRDISNKGKQADDRRKEIGKEILRLMDDRDRVAAGDFEIVRIRQQRVNVDLALLRSDMDSADVAKYERAVPVEYPKVTRKDK